MEEREELKTLPKPEYKQVETEKGKALRVTETIRQTGIFTRDFVSERKAVLEKELAAIALLVAQMDNMEI